MIGTSETAGTPSTHLTMRRWMDSSIYRALGQTCSFFRMLLIEPIVQMGALSRGRSHFSTRLGAGLPRARIRGYVPFMRTTANTARLILASAASALLLLFTTQPAGAQEHIVVDTKAATTPFPHFWEQTFGSGRAILSLRQSYRDDLRTVKQATDFQSIRFHAIFHDEVGLYDPDRRTKNPGLAAQAANDASVYNFSYVDQIYDGLLAEHVRPNVELSFMPKQMSSDPAALHAFWSKPNVAPPKDYALWDAMIAAFAQHLVSRYGLDEVATWKFEVWNEPNIDFWVGNPKQSTYFQLYDHTAHAIKAVSPRLQVGGPSTAQAAWVAPFLAHTKAEDVPVDFRSEERRIG